MPARSSSSTSGGGTLPADPGTAASFQVTGEPNQAYSLAYGDGIVENAAGDQMTVTGFSDNSLGILPGSGSETFSVGATLNLNALQPPGSYSTGTGGGGGNGGGTGGGGCDGGNKLPDSDPC